MSLYFTRAWSIINVGRYKIRSPLFIETYGVMLFDYNSLITYKVNDLIPVLDKYGLSEAQSYCLSVKCTAIARCSCLG